MSGLDAKVLQELEKEDPEEAQAYLEQLDAEKEAGAKEDIETEYVFEFGGEEEQSDK
jgi:hypothetical protein